MSEELVTLSKWAPVVGNWNFDQAGNPTFVPPDSPLPSFGICVSAQRLTEGSAWATVSLSRYTSGRLLFDYRSPNDYYLTAGLSGYGNQYVVADFEPSFGWRRLAYAGTESNIKHNSEYLIETRLKGQHMVMSVDGITVLDHLLDRPLRGGQIGLFAWTEKREGGGGTVSFKNVRAQPSRGRAFVVMKFSEPYLSFFKDVIQPVAAEDKFRLDAKHAGEVFGPGLVLNDIVTGIRESRVIIAEITPASQNENVFYELGYAHAIGTPTILLAERGKPLPFDISGYRCIFYDNTIGGKKQVEEALRKHLAAILGE